MAKSFASRTSIYAQRTPTANHVVRESKDYRVFDSNGCVDVQATLTAAGVTQTPSSYQLAVYHEMANTKNNIAVQALAGSGKSTTMVNSMFLLNPADSVLFCAFAKINAEDIAAKCVAAGLANVTAKTTHSICFKSAMGYAKSKDKGCVVESKKGNIIADRVAIAAGHLEVISHYGNPQTRGNAMIVNDIVTAGSIAMATLTDMGDVSALYRVCQEYDKELEMPETSLPLVAKWAAEMAGDCSMISFDEMVYWVAIGRATPDKFNMVIVDEAQDTNACQMAALLKMVDLANGHGRMVIVGDHNQCLVDGVNVGTTMEPMLTENVSRGTMLTVGRGRGETERLPVSKVHRQWVETAPVVTVETVCGKKLTTTHTHIHFAGYTSIPAGKNTGATSFAVGLCVVYLMRRGKNFRVGTSRVYAGVATKGSGSFGWMTRCNQEGADAVWLLKTCENAAISSYWEQLFSVKYGIPTWVFNANRANNLTGNDPIRRHVDDDLVADLFSAVDSEAGATRLLKELNMHIQYPHHVPKCTTIKRRRNLTITQCADPRSPNVVYHSYAVSGSSKADADKIRNLGLGINVRAAKNRACWRVEGCKASLGEINELCEAINKVVPLRIQECARLVDGPALPHCPASHLREGMSIFVRGNDGRVHRSFIKSVTFGEYTGHVHDYDVPPVHNFCANGIMVHNSIYGFRGAHARAMGFLSEKMAEQAGMPVSELPLSICYRCSHAVLEMARTLVSTIEDRPGVDEGKVTAHNPETYGKTLGSLTSGDLVICRVNAPLVSGALACIARGVAAFVQGKDIGYSVKVFIRHAFGITKGSPTLMLTAPEFIAKVTLYANEQADKARAAGYESKAIGFEDKRSTAEALIAGFEGAFTIKDVENRIDDVFADDAAGVKFSTIHKAKGTEADRVVILGPEMIPHPMAKSAAAREQEKHIHYVAITRAKKTLELQPLPKKEG